jgi:hypothetical protein
MKYVVNINDRKLLVDAAQLTQLSAVLAGCEFMEEKYLGSNQGTHGDNLQYIDVLKKVPTRGWLNVQLVDDDYYDALKFTQQINKTSNP